MRGGGGGREGEGRGRGREEEGRGKGSWPEVHSVDIKCVGTNVQLKISKIVSLKICE